MEERWEVPPAAAGASISATGVCPGPEAVTAAVASLIPRQGGVGALPPSAQVHVDDLGDSYRVTLHADGKERVRAYRDASRDCEQRARFVAVFIVLTLMPPELLVESPPKPPPEEVPPPPPVPAPAVIVAAPSPGLPRYRAAVAGLLDFAPAISDAPAIASPGLELRFAAEAGRFGLTAGVGLEPAATFSVGGLDGRERRVPFDVGASARAAWAPVELAAEVGLAAALFNAGGTNSAVPASGTRLDLGARAALTSRLGGPRARIAPVLGLHALYFPRPYEIQTVPGGVVGHMPSLRVGATAGASLAF